MEAAPTCARAAQQMMSEPTGPKVGPGTKSRSNRKGRTAARRGRPWTAEGCLFTNPGAGETRSQGPWRLSRHGAAAASRGRWALGGQCGPHHSPLGAGGAQQQGSEATWGWTRGTGVWPASPRLQGRGHGHQPVPRSARQATSWGSSQTGTEGLESCPGSGWGCSHPGHRPDSQRAVPLALQTLGGLLVTTAQAFCPGNAIQTRGPPLPPAWLQGILVPLP